MKRIYIILLFSIVATAEMTYGQGVGISESTFTPNSQAILDLTSDRRGFLPPRLELNGNDLPINGTKPAGLMVYNVGGAIGDEAFYYWTGSAWVQVATGSNVVSGSGTVNYIPKWTPDGSTIGDSQLFDNGSSVGIGTSSPDAAYKTTIINGNNEVKLAGSSQALYTRVNAGSEDGIYSLHESTSGSSSYYAIRGEVERQNGIGYLGYHTSGDRSYAVYGASGTFAGYFEGHTNVATGNVGIGTNLPATDRLVVQGGRIEFTDNTDASGATGTGVLEIDNTLRFDGNEVITSSGTPLLINYDNNTNVSIDGNDNTFTVDASNNRVGIGTSTPASNLSVFNGNETTTQSNFTQAIDNSGVLITTDYTNGAYTPGLFWNTTNDNSNRPKAGIYLQTSTTGSKMIFGTSTTYASGITNDAMVIDDLGNVGVGTVTPSMKFQVNSTGSGGIGISDNGYVSIRMDGADNKSLWIHYGGDGTNELRFGRTGDGLSGVWEANVVRWDMDAPEGSIILDGSGGLGIGSLAGSGTRFVVADASGNLTATSSTSSGIVTGSGATNRATYWTSANQIGSSSEYLFDPANSNLSVYNSESTTGEVRLGAAWNRPGVYSSTDLNLFAGGSGNPIIIGNNNNELLRVENNGIIRMDDTKNTNYGLEWYYGSASDRYGIAQASGGNMALYAAANYAPSFISFNLANTSGTFDELARISHAGNLGIGTTGPVDKLHVAAAEGQGVTIGAPNDAMGFNGGSTSIKFYGYRDVVSNAIGAKISAERTNLCCGWLSQGTELAFYTSGQLNTSNADNSVERVRITGDGVLQAKYGLQTERRYTYYSARRATNGSSVQYNLGAWDYCASGGHALRIGDDTFDGGSDNDRFVSECWVEIQDQWPLLGGDQLSSWSWNYVYSSKPTWYLYMYAWSQYDQHMRQHCMAVCVNFDY